MTTIDNPSELLKKRIKEIEEEERCFWMDKLFELGLLFQDDTDSAKRIGKHFNIRFHEDVMMVVNMIAEEIDRRQMDNNPDYQNAWCHGFSKGYEQAMQAFKSVKH
jgi:hypothetical protein